MSIAILDSLPTVLVFRSIAASFPQVVLQKDCNHLKAMLSFILVCFEAKACNPLQLQLCQLLSSCFLQLLTQFF